MPSPPLPAPNKKAAPLDGMPETYFLLKLDLVIPGDLRVLIASLPQSRPRQPFLFLHVFYFLARCRIRENPNPQADFQPRPIKYLSTLRT
jgi:hypothetical protein